MSDNIDDQITNLRKQIDKNLIAKDKISKMRQDSEERHYNRLKRLEEYMNCESLSKTDRENYVERRTNENKDFLQLNDEYENAIRMIDKENEEHEDKIRELSKQSDEESKEKEEESKEE